MAPKNVHFSRFNALVVMVFALAGLAVGVAVGFVRAADSGHASAGAASAANASPAPALDETLAPEATGPVINISERLSVLNRRLVELTLLEAAELTERATGESIGRYTIFAGVGPEDIGDLAQSDPALSLLQSYWIASYARARMFVGFTAERIVVIQLATLTDGDGQINHSLLLQIASHEFVHVIQRELWGASGGRFPRWFIEGEAEYFSEKAVRLKDPEAADRHRARAIEGARSTVAPLSELASTDAYDDERLYSIYPVGHLAASQLFANSALEQPLRMDGRSFGKAFRNTFGRSLASFYEEFETERQAAYPAYESGLRVTLAAPGYGPRARVTACPIEPALPCVAALTSDEGIAQLRVHAGEVLLAVTETLRDGSRISYYEDGRLVPEFSDRPGLTIPEGTVVELDLR